MPRIVVAGASCSEFAGETTEFEIEATTVREAIRALDRIYPGFGNHIERRIAIAIDGEIHQDALFAPLTPHSEIYLIPKIGGG